MIKNRYLFLVLLILSWVVFEVGSALPVQFQVKAQGAENFGHFWTTDPNGEGLNKTEWQREGIACWVIKPDLPNPPSGSVPFWRFYSSTAGIHFWTTDPNGEGLDKSFHRESSAALVFTSQVQGTVPLYRFWSASANAHFWTTDRNGEQLPKDFKLEGAVCYVYPNAQQRNISIVPFYRFLWKSVPAPVSSATVILIHPGDSHTAHDPNSWGMNYWESTQSVTRKVALVTNTSNSQFKLWFHSSTGAISQEVVLSPRQSTTYFNYLTIPAIIWWEAAGPLYNPTNPNALTSLSIRIDFAQ